jgi:hypothetical protein|tara:strand:- start:5332 stop:5478 length:147 start_codon:yes stop_codon:yes gene_type:complete
MSKKPQPKFKNMTEDEIKEWKEKLQEFNADASKRHMIETINKGRGWIF